jgi:putative membrane protein
MRRVSWHHAHRAFFGVLITAWLAPGNGWAQDRTYEWSWGMHPMGWVWGAWGIGMMLMMLVFWGLLIAGIVVGIRWLVRQDGGARRDAALEILRERYARGEIAKEEFDARKRDLT